VGVGVYEARADDLARGIKFDCGLPIGAHLGRWPNGDDAPTGAGHRPVLDESQAAQGASPLGAAILRRDDAQLGGGMDEQISMHLYITNAAACATSTPRARMA
jgi:hypothetical protein